MRDQDKNNNAIDVVQLIDDGGWSRYQKMILVYLALVFGADGMANHSLGVTLPALIESWGGTRPDFAPIIAANLTGVVFGTVLGGFFGDRIGRRWALIASVGLFSAMTLASVLATGISSLAILRFVDGLGIGGAIANGAAMISEVTPRRKRGTALAVGMMFLPLGGASAGMLAGLILPSLGWQAMFFTCGMLALLLAVFFIFKLPESPFFLITDNAKQVRLHKLLQRFELDFHPESNFTRVQTVKAKATLGELLGAGRRSNTLLLWWGFVTCLMASYTVFSWVPTVLSSISFSIGAAGVALGLLNLGSAAGSVFSGVLIDKNGFRKAHVILCGGGALIALVLGIFLRDDTTSSALLLALMLCEGFFLAAIHNSLYTRAASLYPPSVRGTGVGVASAMGKVGAVTSSVVGVVALELGGGQLFFLVVMALLLLCMLTAVANVGKEAH